MHKPVLLTDAADPQRVGHKFANLARHAREFPVPPAVCLPQSWLLMALGDRLAVVKHLLEELTATGGATLGTVSQRLEEILGDLQVPDECKNLLQVYVDDLSAGGRYQICVRSSATDEDDHLSSAAGIYHSELSLSGVDDACAAVVRIWRSYFDLLALSHRLRYDTTHSPDAMAVIVQRMIPAALSGVAIAGPAGVEQMEFVEGAGEGLTSGVAIPLTYGPGFDSEQPHQHVLEEVRVLVERLAAARAEHIDVEWVHDGARAWLVQVRPVVSTHQPPERASALFFRVSRLYEEEVPGDFPLGPLAPVYRYVQNKRAPVFSYATGLGIPVVRGRVIAFNYKGIAATTRPELLNWAEPDLQGTFLVDVAPQLRQVTVAGADLPEALLDLVGASSRDERIHTVMVREFFRGDFGILTHRLPGEAVFAEWSAEGLVGLNRGTSGAQQATLAGQADIEAFAAALRIPTPVAQQFADATRSLDQKFPGIHLEWVIVGGVPHLVDFSRPRDLADPAVSTSISPGSAEGPALVLNDSTSMEILSMSPQVNVHGVDPGFRHRVLTDLLARVGACAAKPVVVAERPYAGLAVLLDLVAGFVFHEGAALSHLGIMLRERDIPAVRCHLDVASGVWLRITDGQVTVDETPSQPSASS